MLLDGFNDYKGKADIAVVLGNKVFPDRRPHPRTQARLTSAKILYDTGRISKIVVSGGKGVEGVEEADCMQEYLATNGVPTSDIIVDRLGMDTFATARSTRLILHDLKLKSAIVVTSYFHIFRSKWIFSQQGIPLVYGVHSRFFEIRDVYSMLREFPAFYYYWLRELLNNTTTPSGISQSQK
jgi:uncharacterized SAM-binding protein YcdF (DUF218 family)